MPILQWPCIALSSTASAQFTQRLPGLFSPISYPAVPHDGIHGIHLLLHVLGQCETLGHDEYSLKIAEGAVIYMVAAPSFLLSS